MTGTAKHCHDQTCIAEKNLQQQKINRLIARAQSKAYYLAKVEADNELIITEKDAQIQALKQKQIELEARTREDANHLATLIGEKITLESALYTERCEHLEARKEDQARILQSQIEYNQLAEEHAKLQVRAEKLLQRKPKSTALVKALEANNKYLREENEVFDDKVQMLELELVAAQETIQHLKHDLAAEKSKTGYLTFAAGKHVAKTSQQPKVPVKAAGKLIKQARKSGKQVRKPGKHLTFLEDCADDDRDADMRADEEEYRAKFDYSRFDLSYDYSSYYYGYDDLTSRSDSDSGCFSYGLDSVHSALLTILGNCEICRPETDFYDRAELQSLVKVHFGDHISFGDRETETENHGPSW
ncbi:hypothetical protein OHC33_005598 [Knufia fluminis]|uniref:Uncharacterized protein n=1 Tax=Knufia fluminis TaxID=191047 RepID=A0AAN8EEB8_9EURO|nr:hypothetical protein OHC33_005598 [Knufia fluminis]